jgi:tetratricopeptide (TPR) repeat protein
MRAIHFGVLLLAVLTASCGTGPPQTAPQESNIDLPAGVTVSLLGDTLALPLFDTETAARLEQDALDAAADLERDPSAENFVWLGRRLAYLWRYERAIAVFTNGIRAYPDDAALYRHRGHRLITLRRFQPAIADLRQAAALVEGRPDEIELDGAPNAANIPRTTLHFNLWYHLGLAYYLNTDFVRAGDAFRRALDVSRNDDAIVAAADWLYMSLRRGGRDSEAAEVLGPIELEMDILENSSYHRRLLMYKGLLEPDSLLGAEDELDLATQGYGVANWYLYNGDSAAAETLFRRVVDGDYWPAFGYIAAEAELARNP